MWGWRGGGGTIKAQWLRWALCCSGGLIISSHLETKQGPNCSSVHVVLFPFKHALLFSFTEATPFGHKTTICFEKQIEKTQMFDTALFVHGASFQQQSALLSVSTSFFFFFFFKNSSAMPVVKE